MMAELRHYLRTHHECLVRTELGPAEVEGMFAKDALLRGGKGMFGRQPIFVWRMDDGSGRFGFEPFHVNRLATGFTAADVHAYGPGTEVGCVSRLKKFNWIVPAMCLVIALGIATAGPADATFSVGVLLAASAIVMMWFGYCRFRLARDHDAVVQYVALAINGLCVDGPAGQARETIAVGAA